MRNGDEILLKTWAAEVFEKMDKIAHMLDSLQGSDTYYQVLQKQLEAVNDPDKTLSAKVLQGMQDAGKGFFDFTWEQSQNSFQHNKRHNIEPDNERHLLDISHQSVIAQQRIEQSDTLSFDEYLAAYFEQ
jgi:glutamate--cysteine ligase